MALNPILREMVAAASARMRPTAVPVELDVPHLVACLAELGLQKATKRELLRVVKTALEREATEQHVA